MKDIGRLADDRHIVTDGILGKRPDLLSVQENPAPLGIVQTADQIEYRRFAAAALADKGHHLSCTDGKAHVAENRLQRDLRIIGSISEVDLFESDLTLRLFQLDRAETLFGEFRAVDQGTDALEASPL